MDETIAQILHRPESAALRFLPEGPCWLGEERISWVAIQHGADAANGSLNILDLKTRENTSTPLEGRPGFAFPTDQPDVFLVGQERRLCSVNLANGESTDLAADIEQGVENTIINDGELFDEGVVFGAKDLEFQTKKAGLYFWRRADRHLFKLRDDQICSNGKVLLREDGGKWRLLDIDSPTKTVASYSLDISAGALSPPETVIDLRDGDSFPDGMVATPDGKSVIIAFYNPNDAEFGEARQIRIADGVVEAVWKTPGAPQVTCPLLAPTANGMKLVLTTAVEHMPPDRLAQHPNSGCLFIADTAF